MFAHAIHLTDRQPGGEKARVDFDQIAFLEPRLERPLHTRGAATRDQEEDILVPVDKIQHLATGGETPGRDFRMTSPGDPRMAVPVPRMRAGRRAHPKMR